MEIYHTQMKMNRNFREFIQELSTAETSGEDYFEGLLVSPIQHPPTFRVFFEELRAVSPPDSSRASSVDVALLQLERFVFVLTASIIREIQRPAEDSSRSEVRKLEKQATFSLLQTEGLLFSRQCLLLIHLRRFVSRKMMSGAKSVLPT